MNRIANTTVLARFAAAAIVAAGLIGATAAQAYNQGVKIFNDGRNDIHYVHITPIEWDDWGDDLLGYQVVEPGDEIRVDLALYDGACVYDVLITFDTPRGLEDVMLWGVDLCESDMIAADEWEVVTA